MHDRPQAKQRHWPDRPVGATGSHVPCKSLSQARATSTPGAIWAVNRLPPDSSRGSKASPVSTPPESFDTSSVVRSRSPSWLVPAALNGATFPVTLTTTALYRSSSRWFAASACTAAAEGHRANSTLLLHLLHSTAFRIWVFYIQPPSTFVAHQWTNLDSIDRGPGHACLRRRAVVIRLSAPAPPCRPNRPSAPRRPITMAAGVAAPG